MKLKRKMKGESKTEEEGKKRKRMGDGDGFRVLKKLWSEKRVLWDGAGRYKLSRLKGGDESYGQKETG